VAALGRRHATAAAAAQRRRVETVLRWLSLTDFFILRGGAMWGAHLGHSCVAGSTKTWRATAAGLTWALVVSGAGSGGPLVM
jgi:hypothetical protein